MDAQQRDAVVEATPQASPALDQNQEGSGASVPALETSVFGRNYEMCSIQRGRHGFGFEKRVSEKIPE